MLLAAAVWGGNFTATKLAFAQLPPLAFNALRFTIGSVVLWAIVRRVEGKVKLPPGTFWPLVWLGVIGNSIYQVFFVLGLEHTSATKSSLILAAIPALVTFVAWALGIERVSGRERVGVVIATIGVTIVILGRGGSLGGGIGVGELLLFGAVLCWAAYTLLLRVWNLPLSPLRVTAWATYTGTPLLILIGIPELRATDWAQVSFAGWGGMLYAALLSLVLSYIQWNRGVAVLGASRTAVYNSVVPLVATLIAMVGLGERPGLIHIVGGVMVVAGVLLTRHQVTAEG